MARDRFRNMGKGSVFACAVCGRKTRYTGNPECCSECNEIAELDNMVNDNGYEPGSKEYEDAFAECEMLLTNAVKKGGSAEKIKDSNGYIWRE